MAVANLTTPAHQPIPPISLPAMANRSTLQRVLFVDFTQRTPTYSTMSDHTIKTINMLAVHTSKTPMKTAQDLPQFLQDVERSFLASNLDISYQTAAALSCLLFQNTAYGRSLGELAIQKCKDLGYTDVQLLKTAMPWDNANSL